MKKIPYLILVVFAGIIGGCAATIPAELVSARQSYQHASEGPAAQMVPAELHKAKEALAEAEESFSRDPRSYHTRDLAYVADRKASLAEAMAAIASAKGDTARANINFQETQGDIMDRTKRDLSRTRTDLAQSERAGEQAADKLLAEQQARLAAEKRSADREVVSAKQLSAEQQARLEAEKRSTNAQAALVKLAAVREEDRGLVITLSGSLLFASNKATLLPAAQSRLNQVAAALLETHERSLIVEGHTDSRGTADYNLNLSQRRADVVRAYLISRDYPADQIRARGIGETQPIGNNASPEGRANNRRVEIVIEKPAVNSDESLSMNK